MVSLFLLYFSLFFILQLDGFFKNIIYNVIPLLKTVQEHSITLKTQLRIFTMTSKVIIRSFFDHSFFYDLLPSHGPCSPSLTMMLEPQGLCAYFRHMGSFPQFFCMSSPIASRMGLLRTPLCLWSPYTWLVLVILTLQ